MAIDSIQEQTMERVDLYLPCDVFLHGQLYVALSRVRAADRITVFANQQRAAYVKNVVLL